MATVSLSVSVPAPADSVWQAVKSPAGFRFVSRGLVRWPVAANRTEPWREGETVSGWMFFFQILPVARHNLTFITLDDHNRAFRTDEHGGIIRSWKHSITVTPVDDSHARVDDSVTFSGGMLTPLLEIAVKTFYLVRRPRWVELGKAISTRTFRV